MYKIHTFHNFSKFDLKKVLGLLWLEIEAKFIADYFGHTGCVFNTNQHV